jgi:long-subunit fatty acid transport protein
MKKLFLFVVMVYSTTMMYAQASGATSYGFRLGVSYSSLSGDAVSNDYNSRIGLHANFLAEIPLSAAFSLQPEIGLSALGVNENEIELDNGDVVQLKTNWLQVAVLAHLKMGHRAFVLIGPQAGVNVTESGPNDYYNYDFDGVVGIGYMFNENLALDLRYGYGLSNVFDKEIATVSDASNRWLQLGVSYRL